MATDYKTDIQTAKFLYTVQYILFSFQNADDIDLRPLSGEASDL